MLAYAAWQDSNSSDLGRVLAKLRVGHALWMHLLALSLFDRHVLLVGVECLQRHSSQLALGRLRMRNGIKEHVRELGARVCLWPLVVSSIGNRYGPKLLTMNLFSLIEVFPFNHDFDFCLSVNSSEVMYSLGPHRLHKCISWAGSHRQLAP